MAKDAPVLDPLSWLHDALKPDLDKFEGDAEVRYSGPDRGSLSIYRQGKLLQTSYFASFELQALKDGGEGALEKQKAAILEQVNRVLNPPKPQPMTLTSLQPAVRRGRAKKAEPAAEEAPAETESTESEEA